MPSYYNTLSRPRTTSPWASQFTTQTWKSRTWMKMNNYHQKLTSDFTKKLFVSRKQTLESNRENTQCDTLHTYIKAINTHRRCQNYCHKWHRSSTIATNHQMTPIVGVKTIAINRLLTLIISVSVIATRRLLTPAMFNTPLTLSMHPSRFWVANAENKPSMADSGKNREQSKWKRTWKWNRTWKWKY